MTRGLIHLVLACALSGTGCAAPVERTPDARGPSGGGKDDGLSRDLGECELQMIMHFLEDRAVTREHLLGIGIEPRIVDAWTAHRAGPDGTPRTPDDDWHIESLVELAQAVPLDDPAIDALADAARTALGWACGPVVEGSTALVRVVAANLTSGTHPAYGAEGTRILSALDADVVLLQEMNVGTSMREELDTWVRDTFGAEYRWVRQEGKAIPNAVITRMPILDHGVWDDGVSPDRDHVWARIDVPGGRDLLAVSVHLATDEEDRLAQARALARELVPAIVTETDDVVIGGDFNTREWDDPARDVLAEVVVTDGPHPTDRDGNPYTNTRRDHPYDGVFGAPGLQRRRAPTRLGTGSFRYGLVADTRVHEPLDDLAPAQRGDSAAFQMQHMAVVRDFAAANE